MKINIVPRAWFKKDNAPLEIKEAETFLKDFRVISIINTSDNPLFMIESPNLLNLRFDDITDEKTAKDFNLILFNDEHVKAIFEFADNENDCPIIVHCTAGICRSGAVGEFLNDYLNKYKVMDLDSDWKQNIELWGHKIIPNVHVKSLLNRALVEKGF